jgi:hypothetical protein
MQLGWERKVKKYVLEQGSLEILLSVLVIVAIQFPLRVAQYSLFMNKRLLGVGLEILETVPKFLQPSLHLTNPAVKKKQELCIRETHWTEAMLEKLHQDMKSNKPYKNHFLVHFPCLIGNNRNIVL